MPITVVNNVADIQVNTSTDDIKTFPKLASKVNLIGNKVVIKDTSPEKGDTVTLDSSEVSSPSEANNTALWATIHGYLSTGVGISPGGGSGGNDIAIAYEEVVIAGTAVGLASIPGAAVKALMTFERDETDVTDIPVRYTEDSTVVTASVGHALRDTMAFEVLTADNLGNFSAIRVTSGTSHSLKVTYFS